jgi:hypothetical protein
LNGARPVSESRKPREKADKMTMKGTIILNDPETESANIITAFGRKLKIEDVQQVREERTASGKLVRDVISTKTKITVTFSEMDSSDLSDLLYFYNMQRELIIQIYNSETVYSEYTVLMDPIERERILLADLNTGAELYGNLTVVFHEV